MGGYPVPEPIRDLDCTVKCEDGEYLAVDLTTKKSACAKCGANQYSTIGAWIDGQMSDWEVIQKTQAGEGPGQAIAMEFDCYF